jgi:hypothetical protein
MAGTRTPRGCHLCLKTRQLGWKCCFHWKLHHWYYIYLGLGEGPRLHQTLLAGTDPGISITSSLDRCLHSKLDMALSREAPNSSGKNAPFVVSYQLWRPRREIIGWGSWNTQSLAGHTLSMPCRCWLCDGREVLGRNEPNNRRWHCVEEESQLQVSSRHVVSYIEGGCALYDHPARLPFAGSEILVMKE